MQHGMCRGQLSYKDLLKSVLIEISRCPLNPRQDDSRPLARLKDRLNGLVPNPKLTAGLSGTEQDLVRTLQETVDYYKCQNDRFVDPEH